MRAPQAKGPTSAPPARPKRPAAPAAKRKPPKPVDYPTVAAEAACSGQSNTAIEYQLIKHGMKDAAARPLAEFMAAAFQSRLELRKQKKVSMWGFIVVGLVLGAVDLAASFTERAHNSPTLRVMVVSFAVVGAILFFMGLWRFVGGPRPILAADLAAEWAEKQENR
jgi:hypothetical protein